MSDFNSAIAIQNQRLGITKAALPTDNAAAYAALLRADKVNELLMPFIGRNVEGFTEYTPSCFQQVFATAYAVDKDTSLSRARGEGRLATAVDHIRSVGTGFRKNVRLIEQFLGIEESTLIYNKRQYFRATMPEVTNLFQSAHYYNRMETSLAERENAAREGSSLSKEEKQRLLLTKGWTVDKIRQYTTEYISRAIAHRMPKTERHELLFGDLDFQSALKACGILKLSAAA